MDGSDFDSDLDFFIKKPNAERIRPAAYRLRAVRLELGFEK